LIEARNKSGEEIGAARIMDSLQQSSPQNIKEMLDFALAGMHSFTHNPEQDDDICLVGVEFNEEMH
jgi:serine phosphatase RsbU (regulator of sigma subunit)